MTTAVTEQQLDALFAPGCDPYAAGAAALFGKAEHTVSQDERDLTKRVFMRIAARRRQDEPACTGSFVHDEFTPCPVHDRRSP